LIFNHGFNKLAPNALLVFLTLPLNGGIMGYSRNRSGWMWFVILTLVFGVALTGCGGAEEAMEGDGFEEGEPLGEEQPLGQDEDPAEEPEEDSDADALTSFIGAAEEDDTPAPAQQPAPAQTGQLGLYERQIEELRTENTTLKQRLVKLEQDNRTLNTMVAESESKIQAVRERGDSLEAALMSRPMTDAAPMAQTEAQPRPPADEAPTSDQPAEPMAISSYEDALRAFNARRYDEAIGGLTSMLAQGVSKDLEDNCNYWIGEANFQKRRYTEALASFEKVMAFKTSEKKGHALYMQAQCYERLGDKVKAKEGYEKVVKDYPMSDVVRKAKERWGRL
jgi:TolA-binding protein